MPTVQEYEKLLYSIKDFSNDIETVFASNSNDQGVISNKHIEGLLQDLSNVLPIDINDARDFFDDSNESVEKYFELSRISYQDFIDILKMWLQKKVAEKPKTASQTVQYVLADNTPMERVRKEPEQDEEEVEENKIVQIYKEIKMELAQYGNEVNEIVEDPRETENEQSGFANEENEEGRGMSQAELEQYERQRQEYQNQIEDLASEALVPLAPLVTYKISGGEDNGNTGYTGTTEMSDRQPLQKPSFSAAQRYRANRDKLDELLICYRDEFHEKFELFYDENSERMPISEVFIYLRECFYVAAAQLFEKETDDRDFFEDFDNDLKFRRLADEYFKGVATVSDSQDFQGNFLDFDECFGVLDYWFQIDKDVVLVENPDLKPKEEDTRGQSQPVSVTEVKQKVANDGIDYAEIIKNKEEVLLKAKKVNSVPEPKASAFDDGIDYMEIIRNREKLRIGNKAVNNQETKPQEDDGIDYMEIIRNKEKALKEKTQKVEKQSIFPNKPVFEATRDEMLLPTEKKVEKENIVQKPRRNSDKRLKALREVFDYFAKHNQTLTGKAPTFDKIEKKSNTLNIGKLSIVLKNFRIKYDPFGLKKIFKRVASNSEDLDFEEFHTILQIISKDAELLKGTKIIKPNPNVMKEYKPDSYKNTPTSDYAQKFNGGYEKKAAIKSEDEKLLELWEHMGLYDMTYKNNLQNNHGTLNNNHQEVEGFRYNINGNESRKAGGNMKLDGLRDESRERSEPKRRSREGKLGSLSSTKAGRESMKKLEPLSRKEVTTVSVPASIKRTEDPSSGKMKKSKTTTAFDKKLSLHEIGKFNYTDLKGMGGDMKFNPTQLIQEDDEEDKLYLKEYNLDYKIQRPKNIVKKNEDLASISNVKVRMPGKYSTMKDFHEMSMRTASTQIDDAHSTERQVDLASINYTQKAHSANASGHGQPYNMNMNVMAGYFSVKNTPIPQPFGGQFPPAYGHQESKSLKSTGLSYNPSGDMMNSYSQYVNKGIGLERINQIQQGNIRRENEMMYNIMNIQNARLEQGLKVAKKY